VRWWGAVVGIVALVGIGMALRARVAPAPVVSSDAAIVHGVVAREGIRVDLFLPPAIERPAPWIALVHDDANGDDRARFAEVLQRRGIAVAWVAADGDRTPRQRAEAIAAAVRDLAQRSADLGIVAEPVLAGIGLSASLVAAMALDPQYGFEPARLRGVIAMNGIYDAPDEALAPLRHVRADAPPFLIVSAHADAPVAARSSRALARALERAGARDVRSYHVASRDAGALHDLSGERNDVADLVRAFARREPTPGGPEGAWSITDAWGAHAPFSSEPFGADRDLVVRRPVDAGVRAKVQRVFADTMRDLEPWPLRTYDAIALSDYLRAHPELGAGDWVTITNARGERVILRRADIARYEPRIVIGLDDESNLFRLFVTYNVYRTYSWKPETEPRPLLVRPVGAFLYFTVEPPPEGGLRIVTFADFALTTASVRVVGTDPVAAARGVPKALAAALSNEQGCLQCHALRGVGARSHHLRAVDGEVTHGFALPFEDYPPGVLRRFLFEQDDVAQTFGVNPLRVDAAASTELIAEVSR
jgi:hypothetical protein